MVIVFILEWVETGLVITPLKVIHGITVPSAAHNVRRNKRKESEMKFWRDNLGNVHAPILIMTAPTNPNDTPRTDANIKYITKRHVNGMFSDYPVIEVDFARTLERELNAAKSEIERLKKTIANPSNKKKHL